MQIPSFIAQIPSYTQSAYRGCLKFHQRILTETFDNWSGTDLWQEYGKPFYKRYIKPLNDQTAISILGGILGVAFVISTLAIKIFGVIALPFSLGGSAILFLGTFSYISQSRINHYFNEKAWGHINEMRKIIGKISAKKQDFDQLHPHRKKLDKPEFEHLQKKIKKLDKEIAKFQKLVSKPHYEDQLEVVEAKLEHIEDEFQGSSDQIIIQSLKEEVMKIGTEEENIKAIEAKKKDFASLLNPKNIMQITEIKDEIQTLFSLSRKPHFRKSQASLLNHIKELQKELASHLPIDEKLLEEEDLIASEIKPYSEEESSSFLE